MKSQKNLEQILRQFPQIFDPVWRLTNLYWIKDKDGNRVKFKPNYEQLEILKDPHPLEIILKCRQIGMTTFYALRELDAVLWNDNRSAGIIAQTFDDGSKIFKEKLKYAFDNIDPRLRPFFRIVGDSAKELSFAHGSSIRVGTSLRSSTLQDLHISEFGKICAKDPERAREIITGSLNTVSVGQNVVIESTAEGSAGYFKDMFEKAWELKRSGKPLTSMDYKARFFSWHEHPEYTFDGETEIPDKMNEYFDKLYVQGIKLTQGQKNWYTRKYETQGEDMLREYPSFPEEAFQASQEGFWYASAFKELHDAGHIRDVSYDKALPVHTAWDLGQRDSQAIWFFQLPPHGDINVIDFMKRPDMKIEETVQMLRDKGYSYGTHIWPHDAKARGRGGITFEQQASGLNLSGYVLEQAGKLDGIRLVRTTLGKCWFDKNKCKQGIHDLQNYKKRWNASIGGWTSEPVHDDCSDSADAFRYLAQGYKNVENSNDIGNDIKALRAYWG